MAFKPIDDVTDVDVKINEYLGLILNDHSGVVEIAVRTLERERMSCGCCYETNVSYTTASLDDDELAQMVDGYSGLKSDYYENNLEESLAWKIDKK